MKQLNGTQLETKTTEPLVWRWPETVIVVLSLVVFFIVVGMSILARRSRMHSDLFHRVGATSFITLTEATKSRQTQTDFIKTDDLIVILIGVTASVIMLAWYQSRVTNNKRIKKGNNIKENDVETETRKKLQQSK